MPINLDEALGAELEPAEFSWTSSDVQLYHLGLGAGQDPMDKRELRYLVDDTPQVLPTFGNVAQSFHMTEPPSVKFPGIDIELSRVLHASEAVSAPAPIPPSGTGVAVTKFTDIWDKGKAAVIWSETTVTAPDGTPLWTQKRSIFARGEGGFGGERGPSTSSEPPERAPDFELAIPVSPQQALLYRMCGDRNPLHSDPEFAAAAGFPRPILHGLCTYGMTCKAMVDALLDGDTSRVGSYGARFAGVVFPGETLKVNVDALAAGVGHDAGLSGQLLRRDGVAHHQESDGFQPQFAGQPEMLDRHVGLGAVGGDPADRAAVVLRFLDVLFGAHPGQHQERDLGFLGGLGREFDQFLLGGLGEAVVEARPAEPVAVGHLDDRDARGVQCRHDSVHLVGGELMAFVVRAVAQGRVGHPDVPDRVEEDVVMLMLGLLPVADSDSLAISSPTLVAAAVMMSRFPA